MEIGDILKETNPEVKGKLEKLRAKLLKREVSYETFKKEMLADPIIKEQYEKLEPKFRKIRAELKAKGEKKKEDKNEILAV